MHCCSKGQQPLGLHEAEHCQQAKRGDAFPVGRKSHKPWGGCRYQVLSKMPTGGFASPLTVAGWIRLLIFITCTGLCLAEICSQADGMAKFSSSSTANSLQDTFAKDRRVESHNFLWTEGFYFFFFHLVDVASCWSLPQRVEVFNFVSQLGHLTALLTTTQLFLSWVW